MLYLNFQEANEILECPEVLFEVQPEKHESEVSKSKKQLLLEHNRNGQNEL